MSRKTLPELKAEAEQALQEAQQQYRLLGIHIERLIGRIGTLDELMAAEESESS